jgi:uncharacterized protein (DUF1697 family)
MIYYVFLKGINVGGTTKVDMTTLKKAIQALGNTRVSSYLNSGNLLIKTDICKEILKEKIQRIILQESGLETRAIIRTREQIEEALAINPFKEDTSKVLIYFFEKPTTQEKLANFKNGSKALIEEACHGKEDFLIVFYHNGIGKSKLSTNYIDKVLDTCSTGRNINTLETLLSRSIDG